MHLCACQMMQIFTGTLVIDIVVRGMSAAMYVLLFSLQFGPLRATTRCMFCMASVGNSTWTCGRPADLTECLAA